MVDVFSKEKRSEIMSLIRSKDTKVERKFRALLSSQLYPLGYRYRKNYKSLPGKPDVVFVRQKIAIFVDGDFWHGRNFKTRGEKLSKEYWRPKILKNKQRDARTNRRLRSEGWTVIRFWETDFSKKPQHYIEKVLKILLKADG